MALRKHLILRCLAKRGLEGRTVPIQSIPGFLSSSPPARGGAKLVCVFVSLTLLWFAAPAAAQRFGAEITTLDNGMQVVVVPNHRFPAVQQMVRYKIGGADDPPGKSGLAHFLEHLMFKGTAANPPGAFSALI